MTNRIPRILLVIAAVSALVAALAGGASAHKPGKNDKQGKHFGSGKHQGGKKQSLTTATTGGMTTLTIDPALAATLAGVPITVSGLAPASGSFDFPVTKARVAFKKGKKHHHGYGAHKSTKGHGKHGKKGAKAGMMKLAGFVNHSGGLNFMSGTGSASLSNFRINLSAHKRGTLAGNVNDSPKRVRLGRLSDVSYDMATKTIMATVTLTRRAADTLNGALGIGTALSKTTVLGTVKIVLAS